MSCAHVLLDFSADLFPDSPRLAWCTVCGSLLDAETNKVLAEPVIVKGILIDRQDVGARIDEIYARLAQLADQHDSRVQYNEALGELRRLQTIEAEALRLVLRGRRQLDPDKLKEAIASAEDYLARRTP